MSVVRNINGAIDIKIKLDWKAIETEIQKQTDLAIKEVEIPGFRKGKAPKDMAVSKLDQSQLLSKSLSELLPPVYSEIVKTNDLKPVLYPQVVINKGKWGEDFEFTATTCEAPKLDLPENYQQEIANLKPKSKEEKLATILEYLHKNSRIQVPDPLVTEEANHRLSHLAENLSQIGMDMSKYLTTKKITAEDLKSQTAQTAKTDLEMEFILASIQSQNKLSDRKSTLDFLEALIKS